MRWTWSFALAALAGLCGCDDGARGGPVTVRVYGGYGGVPHVGGRVLVHDVDGAVLDEAVTGADGTVVLDDVPAGGAVTSWAVRETLLEVQPGDALVFGSAVARPPRRQVGALRVSFPEVPDATFYVVSIGAETTWVFEPGTAEVPIYQTTPARATVAVTALRAGEPSQIALVGDVEIRDGATVAITDFAAARASVALTVTGLPAQARNLDLTTRLDGVAIGDHRLDQPTTELRAQLEVPAGVGHDFALTANLWSHAPPGAPDRWLSLSQRWEHRAAPSDLVLDVTTGLLPWASAIASDGRVRTVTPAWPAPSIDEVALTLAPAVAYRSGWTVRGPGLTARIPELPPELASEIDLAGPVTVTLSEADDLDGWDAVRARPTADAFAEGAGRVVRVAAGEVP